VHREDVDMLDSLIEAGADINIVNRLGTSPLFIATEVGHTQLIERLLEAGADPNLALHVGETPVMTAARSGSAVGVRHLIEAGADVDASESSRGQTALMWAAAQGHVDVARVLIDAGADLEARSKVRPRLMFVNDASNGGQFDQGVMENLGGYSALLFAARQGDVEMASLLLNSGADIAGVAGNGTSPLVVATHSGHGALARMLLDEDADANAMDAGYSAMHAAILRGDLDTVEALLDHSADPNVRLLKPNPVQRASEDWALRPSLVGATPYWIAANFREAEIMRALTDGGADALLTNEEIFSQPRERADRDSYTPEIIGGLASTLQAAIRGDSTRGRFYAQANPNPAGEARLTLAAVKVAADHGVNLNHTDFTGTTALHDAAARGLATVVLELAERGADINALNGRDQTPLDLAIAAESRTSFFGFDLSVSGPSAREVLEEFGAVGSAALQ
jgi:ankyrin repeat protein